MLAMAVLVDIKNEHGECTVFMRFVSCSELTSCIAWSGNSKLVFVMEKCALDVNFLHIVFMKFRLQTTQRNTRHFLSTVGEICLKFSETKTSLNYT